MGKKMVGTDRDLSDNKADRFSHKSSPKKTSILDADRDASDARTGVYKNINEDSSSACNKDMHQKTEQAEGRKQKAEIKTHYSPVKTGLMPKDEMRGKNERKIGVYREVNDNFKRVFNKADRFSHKSSRYRARRYAMQAIYQWSFSKTPWLDLIEQFLTANETHLKTDIDYFTDLVRGILDHIQLIDKTIAQYIDRPFEELNPVELAVLRLSFYELLYQSQMNFRESAQIDPSILGSKRGGEKRATGVYKKYMTVARDDANKAESQKTKGIFQKEVPPKVILNEAIELTKSFGSTDGYKYVNAVLDAFINKK